MNAAHWSRLLSATCALMLSWSSARVCFAEDVRGLVAQSARPGLAPYTRAITLTPERDPRAPWLWAAAGTTATFALGYAFMAGFSYKARNDRALALANSRDLRLDVESRTRASQQASDAKWRSELFERVSSVCLAGSIAATGTMLLIWLTSKEKRKTDANKYLIGPMVLREFAGAGIVMREKF